MQKEAELKEALGVFIQETYITDVLHNLKSGKEATVFVCRAHPSTGHELLAAKAYRQESDRSFKNDAVYLQGRFPTADDQQALVRKRNFKGGVVRRGAWLDREFDMLSTLWSGGGRVPRPITRSEDAILMEYLGDAGGPIPDLKRARPSAEDAARVYRQVMDEVELMLAHHCVHGDLSEYNVLYDGEAVTVIDFPQSVDPRFNRSAAELLRRDIENVCAYFSRLGVETSPDREWMNLWERYVMGLL